jgi:cation diffusion facilitator family transporter
LVQTAEKQASTQPIRLALLAIIVGLVVLAIKYAAFRITGSISLFSDALESIVNTVAAIGMFFALRLAAQPPDRNHPYGHGKVEYFASVIEGAMILYAAVEIMRAAWGRLWDPVPLDSLDIGVGLAVGATAVNAVMATVLIREGRKHRSPALFADGRHLWADVWTTISVLVGIGLAWITGFWLLDPILAVAVGIHVLWVGFNVVRDSVGGLMDQSLPERDMHRIRTAIEANLGKAHEVHDLRSRLAAGRPFVEFHLVVPRGMSVGESHEICDDLETAIKQIITTASVLIHVEPEEKAKQKGLVVQID